MTPLAAERCCSSTPAPTCRAIQRSDLRADADAASPIQHSEKTAASARARHRYTAQRCAAGADCSAMALPLMALPTAVQIVLDVQDTAWSAVPLNALGVR